MSLDERPLETLRRIAEARGTGELICASATAEVHVYLQHGRVAWATDSEHPFAFTRYLQKIAEIDPESFRDILDSCRREKRPLGETLVSWGVATQDEVRDALRHQVRLALDVLAAARPAKTVFLDRTRQFAQYDAAFTFGVEELLTGTEETPEPRRASRAPGPAGPVSAPPAQYARRLLDSVEGIAWAELLEGTAVADAAPERAPEARVPLDVARATVLDGAELVAMRAPEGTLAGVALPDACSLWCRLAAESTVGSAVAALSGFGAADRASGDFGVAERGALWSIGATESPAMTALHDFLGRASETLAALVTELGDGPWSCGAGGGVPAEYALDLVRRRARALAAPSIFDRDASAEDDVGFRFRSMLTRERRVWCFGAELGTKPRRILSLLLHRRSSQGLGWAYLTSLSRQLLHLRGWERHG